ncbi:hypothetical protein ACN28E_08440 [Archangium lansingense]|uniref:hypothetical protein n=1 Tax=Archangium lansingense TaxID=2995310 RepID=UPI003B7A7E74
MRWPFVLGIALLTGFLGTGCPEVYGRGGYLDDAMREDIQEQMRERREQRRWEKEKPEPCPDGKPPTQVCDDPADSKKCHWECR